MTTPLPSDSRPAAANQEPTEVLLRAKGIEKCFGDTQVLKGISLTARRGDVITLIGSSGSGKSTFLRCLNLLEQPDGGELEVHGQPIHFTTTRHGRAPEDEKRVQWMRSRVAMVFQNFNLWSHMTLLENIIEAPIHVLRTPKAEAIDQARRLLSKVGLEDRANHYPSQLSGGQQQRGAIARALAMNPDVMLFDEPTSALDPELVGDVLAVMHQLAEEGRTMILVTHEMDFARDVSTQIMYLNQGEVEESGPPGRVLCDPRSDRLRQFLSTR
ncbi:ABC transporter ATP-binding protein [Halomonas sp. NCCP-2165]|nr:ATP-binding cassette domain-containing protein [Halomonas sp. NCCP-2165]GKW47799.1 histidine/lysine/arginine/ornithine ABC transporter ATP-binding protein HisP [Halomonas sp. NCCP-2165]